MASEKDVIIWQGTPSHYSSLESYLFWLITFFVILFFIYWNAPQWKQWQALISPELLSGLSVFFIALPIWKLISIYLVIYSTNYQLTNERIITSTGVFSRSHDELELYRIKDYQVEEPFFQRFFSLGTIILETSDKSHPILSLLAIKDPKKIRNIIRERVEILRTTKGVREIDH